MRTRAVLSTIAVAGTLAAGCTPQEVQMWLALHESNPKAAVQLVAPQPAQPAPQPAAHCYIVTGGTYCAWDGTPEAAEFAAKQALYAQHSGVADPGPQPLAPGYPIQG